MLRRIGGERPSTDGSHFFGETTHPIFQWLYSRILGGKLCSFAG